MNTDHTPEAIARRVRDQRKTLGLSQEDMGRKLGLTKVAYGDYERVKRLFDTEQLFALSRILGKPVSWLLGITTRPGELTEDEQQLLSMYRRIKTTSELAAGIVMRQVSAALPEDDPH